MTFSVCFLKTQLINNRLMWPTKNHLHMFDILLPVLKDFFFLYWIPSFLHIKGFWTEISPGKRQKDIKQYSSVWPVYLDNFHSNMTLMMIQRIFGKYTNNFIIIIIFSKLFIAVLKSSSSVVFSIYFAYRKLTNTFGLSEKWSSRFVWCVVYCRYYIWSKQIATFQSNDYTQNPLVFPLLLPLAGER